MTKKLTIFGLIISIILITFPLISSADSDDTGHKPIPALENVSKDINESAKELGYTEIPAGNVGEKLIEITYGVAIRGILSLLGILFLVLIIINGYKWMVAGGNEEIINKAKRGLQNALIGLGIVLLAYLITYGLFSYLENLTIIQPE